jgi:hypothetical protein
MTQRPVPNVLLTDFGPDSWYVGAVKGALLAEAPGAAPRREGEELAVAGARAQRLLEPAPGDAVRVRLAREPRP